MVAIQRLLKSGRAPQTLFGMVWQGTYEEAAAGSVKKTVAEMERLRERLAPGGGNPADGLIGTSWSDIPGGFRYLIALPPNLSGGGEAEGLSSFSFPEMRFATAWHDTADGDVSQHYQRMFAWLEDRQFILDTSILHHREEYPAGLDLGRPPELRMMAPVRAR